MDVSLYRKFNKPGWVVQALAGIRGSYVGSIRDGNVCTPSLENALAFKSFDEAETLSLVLSRMTTSTWKVEPIPDLPKKDASEEIKQELRHVVESIGQFDSTSLTYYGISVKLYDLICQIVDQKLEKR